MIARPAGHTISSLTFKSGLDSCTVGIEIFFLPWPGTCDIQGGGGMARWELGTFREPTESTLSRSTEEKKKCKDTVGKKQTKCDEPGSGSKLAGGSDTPKSEYRNTEGYRGA